jgi:hypothetical protein
VPPTVPLTVILVPTQWYDYRSHSGVSVTVSHSVTQCDMSSLEEIEAPCHKNKEKTLPSFQMTVSRNLGPVPPPSSDEKSVMRFLLTFCLSDEWTWEDMTTSNLVLSWLAAQRSA